jgi:hypothetical protein
MIYIFDIDENAEFYMFCVYRVVRLCFLHCEWSHGLHALYNAYPRSQNQEQATTNFPNECPNRGRDATESAVCSNSTRLTSSFLDSLSSRRSDFASCELTSVAVHEVSFKFEVKVQLFCRLWYRRSWLTRDMRGSSEASKNGRMLGGDETLYEL